MQLVRVRFHPTGETAQAAAGVDLLEAGRLAGVSITSPCGGKGICGKCRLIVRHGEVSDVTEAEREALTEAQLALGERLACQTRALGDVEVELLQAQPVRVRKDISEAHVRPFKMNPRVKQWQACADPPTVEDQRSDLLRLWEAAGLGQGDCRALLPVLDRLPSVLRSSGYRVRGTMLDDLLVEVEPLDDAREPLGAAVDVGSTTVVAYLVNLLTGELLATASTLNPQSAYGADVISRIQYTMEQPEGLRILRTETVGAINRLIADALTEVGADIQQLYEVAVVGNTAIHHLLLGLDPRHIAQAPYVPVVSQPLTLYASDVGIAAHAGGQVFVLPLVAGFVGADTVAVMTAADICKRGPTLAVDIGTNGEIVLWSGERLLCASTAAGPAFEGARISQGMYAAPGAISRVDVVDGDLQVHTIDDRPARGICGSALFDITAALLSTGALGINGRLAENGDGLPADIAARLSGEGTDRRILLAHADTAEHGEAIYLTQRDIREVQLAKGALRAGVETLLEEADLAADDLEAVLLAGAFGNHIRPESAVAMGILPQIPLERIQAVGNAAGVGAVLALCSEQERKLACELARTAEHIELAGSSGFQSKFMETMLFA